MGSLWNVELEVISYSQACFELDPPGAEICVHCKVLVCLAVVDEKLRVDLYIYSKEKCIEIRHRLL